MQLQSIVNSSRSRYSPPPPPPPPTTTSSYVWFPLRIVNVTHQKTHQKNSSRKKKETQTFLVLHHRLNVLDPVPVLGWICCAYHQSTQCRKPCLNNTINLTNGAGAGDGNCELQEGMWRIKHQLNRPAGSVHSFYKSIYGSCAIFFIPAVRENEM